MGILSVSRRRIHAHINGSAGTMVGFANGYKGSNKRYMICVQENDLPIGMIGLYDISDSSSLRGWVVLEMIERGKGFASEAYSLIERFARDYLNLRKIKLSVVSDNLPGVKMWQSLGYEKVGELNEERYIGGQYRNLIIMEKFIQ